MEKKQTPVIKKYDFRRPPKFSLEQIKTVHMIFETFCRLASNDLSLKLRATVGMSISDVDQMTLKEFLESVASPGFVCILQLKPLQSSTLMELTPDSLEFILDWLLGGWEKKKHDSREMTDIELILMEEVMNDVLKSLKRSFGNVVDMEPRIGNIETNPQYMNILPPNSMVLVVDNTITIGDVTGSLRFCIPYILLEPIMEKLSASYWYSSLGTENSETVKTAGLKADAQVILPCHRLTINEVFSLKKGSLVPLPGFEKGEAQIRIGGTEALILQLDKKVSGRDLEFRVQEGTLGAEWDSFIADDPIQSKMKHLEGGVLQQLKGYTDEIGKSISELSRKVVEIADQQNVLTEQWNFQTGGDTDRLSSALEEYPFAFLNDLDAKTVAVFLNGERLQLCALVLSYMEKTRASEVLTLMKEDSAEIVDRIATLSRVHPAIVKMVEAYLKRQFSKLQKESTYSTGGFRTAMEILSHTSRGLEKSILETLEKDNPDTAAGIRHQMFEFEDLLALSEDAMRKVTQSADKENLALALQTASAPVQDFVLKYMRAEDAEKVQSMIRGKGTARLHEIENAQGKIVDLILDLEERGEIVLRSESETMD